MPNAEYGTNKKVVKKNVKYIGRDFSSIRQNLIEFAKSYYPTAYNDFNEASPGMMFIEMAAYVGDVLSYYADNQYRETLLHAAEEKKNIFKIAQSFGYKPKLSSPAFTTADLTIEVPSLTLDDENYEPDTSYALKVDADSLFSSKSGRSFRLLDDIDFAVSTSYDNRVETISKTDGDIPSHFTLTKKANLESGFKTTETFTFGDGVKFDKIILSKKNVIDVLNVVDDDGNTWYSVPFLAQDTVFKDIENNSINSPDVSAYAGSAPFLLKLIKTANRYTTYVRSDGKMELRFGAGISSNADEEIVPNPDNVGSSLGTGLSKLDQSFDPSNFLKTKSFGQAPSNITLTITYTYGGTQQDNVVSGEITNLDSIAFTLLEDGLDSTKVQDTKDSLSIFNPEPATGASGAETPEIVRQNAAAYFHAQNRAVTKEDYITRVYSLPQKYGAIAKVYIVQDEQLEQNTQTIVKNGKVRKQKNVTTIPNPLALNMYVLGFDSKKKLIALDDTVKQNLRIYLSQYRVLTDAINIKDAYTINIAVRFSIITQRGYNKYKVSDGYSGHVYDLQSATKDGVIYSSLDPSIFELKFPNIDIEGRVVGDI